MGTDARWTHHALPGGWTLATRPTFACGESALVAVPTPPGGDPDAAPASHGYVLDDAPEPLAALLGTVAAEIADGSAPVRYGAVEVAPCLHCGAAVRHLDGAPGPDGHDPGCLVAAPADPPRSAPGTVPPFTARAARTGDLFAQDLSDPDRTFGDRATAVSYARRLSDRGTPCDVYDGVGDLVYTRSMDVDATRAQRGLFS